MLIKNKNLKCNLNDFSFNKNFILKRFNSNFFKKIVYIFIKPQLDISGVYFRLNKYLIKENNIEIYYNREFLNEAFFINEKMTWDKKILKSWDEVWHEQTEMDFILDLHNIGILSSVILTPVGENIFVSILSIGAGLYIGAWVLNCIKISIKIFYEAKGYNFLD